MKLSKLFAILVGSIALSGCNTFQTSDFPLVIRLPASRQCFELKVMSGLEKIIPVKECDELISRGIVLTSEAWKLLRRDIQINCQYAQCRQIEGAADGLFLSIDRALDKTIP